MGGVKGRGGRGVPMLFSASVDTSQDAPRPTSYVPRDSTHMDYERWSGVSKHLATKHRQPSSDTRTPTKRNQKNKQKKDMKTRKKRTVKQNRSRNIYSSFGKKKGFCTTWEVVSQRWPQWLGIGWKPGTDGFLVLRSSLRLPPNKNDGRPPWLRSGACNALFLPRAPNARCFCLKRQDHVFLFCFVCLLSSFFTPLETGSEDTTSSMHCNRGGVTCNPQHWLLQHR